MAANVVQRNMSISFDTFPVQRTRKHSFDYKQPDPDLITRRPSIKYHFPILGLDDKLDIDESTISEDDIRRSVFGIPLAQMSFVAVESSVWRPTVASSRRSVLWSRERKLYEEQSKQRMEEFNNRPYMNYEYPELMKHYPGTWRLATKNQLKGIVARLTTNPAPTSASMMCRRRIQSAPVGRPILKKTRVGDQQHH